MCVCLGSLGVSHALNIMCHAAVNVGPYHFLFSLLWDRATHLLWNHVTHLLITAMLSCSPAPLPRSPGDAKCRCGALRAWCFLYTSLNSLLHGSAIEEKLEQLQGLLDQDEVEVGGHGRRGWGG